MMTEPEPFVAGCHLAHHAEAQGLIQDLHYCFCCVPSLFAEKSFIRETRNERNVTVCFQANLILPPAVNGADINRKLYFFLGNPFIM